MVSYALLFALAAIGRDGGSMIPPLLKYPGSKVRLAPWILSSMPVHLHYVEPYCGSAAVFLAKEPSVHEVLNDLNGSIVNFFEVVRTRGEELADVLRYTPWSEAEYLAVEREYICDDPLEHARRFAIRCWQAHGVRLTWTSGWRHNGLNGHSYPARHWKQLPERILLAIERFRDAEIRQRPALEIIRYYNAPDVLLYIDPPYPLSTRNDRLYSHEMSDADHIQLLDTLRESGSMILLSTYENDMYTVRLGAWGWQRATMGAVAEHGLARTEVLWSNPRAARTRQLSLFEQQGGVA